MLVKDQLGRDLSFPYTPRRIVSLVPSQTELLVDLNLVNEIVGVTKFCVHPDHIRKTKTVVGGTKQLHLDKVRRLKPDIVIANKEENTLELVEQLSTICPVWVSDVETIEDAMVMIQSLGELFNKKQKASDLVNRISSGMEDLTVTCAKLDRLKVAYLIWNKPNMAAGSRTFIDHLLKRCNLENVIVEERYPVVDISQLTQAEVILLSSEPFPFKEKHSLQLKELVAAEIEITDGEMWSWYGSRLLKSVVYLKDFRLHLGSLQA
ncbi:ABC transporter substrate-binding protein [Aureitalea marina]|uniref:Cobalamin-binding protein n=1 Tax=Aureitalea marina TaxID=930804 RepID=A0A2S7KMF7_9FLAO|nr:helical backbone metal receptor [Aureitalea marina]PQB03815.1 cobalamin-binding protein [Aureitalea marina]